MIKTALIYAMADWCLDILFGSLDRVFNPEDVYKFKVGDKLYDIAWSVDTNNISFLESITCVMKHAEVIAVYPEYIEIRGIDYGFLKRWESECIAQEDYHDMSAKYKDSDYRVKMSDCCVAVRKLKGLYVSCKVPIRMIHTVQWK